MNIIFIFFSTTEYKNKKFLLCLTILTFFIFFIVSLHLTILTFSQNSMIQTHNSFFLRLVRYKLANVNHKVWIATYKLAILRNCRNSEKWKFFSLQLWLYFLQFSLCHAILKKNITIESLHLAILTLQIAIVSLYISQFWEKSQNCEFLPWEWDFGLKEN